MYAPFLGARALYISLVCAVGFGIVAILVGAGKTARFDTMITAFVQQLKSLALTSVMNFFSFIGMALPVCFLVIIVILFLYKVLRQRTEIFLFLSVVVGSALLNEILKVMFHRAHPILHRLVHANGFSFPSGHAMAAFSLYGIICFLFWRQVSTSIGRALLLVFSLLMIMAIGVSRIYLGVHYPSDVLGGFLASGCWLALALSIWLYGRCA